MTAIQAISIPIFDRQEAIECAIDIKKQLHYLDEGRFHYDSRHPASLKLFIDVLAKLTSDYHANREEHLLRRLADYISHSAHDFEKSDLTHILDRNEASYLEDFKSHLLHLRECLQLKRLPYNEIFLALEKEICHVLSSAAADNRKVKEVVLGALRSYPGLLSSCRNEGENLIFSFDRFNLDLVLIRNWNAFHHVNPTRSVSLIVDATDILRVPNNVFGQGNIVRAALKNAHGGFQQVDNNAYISSAMRNLRRAEAIIINRIPAIPPRLRGDLSDCRVTLQRLLMQTEISIGQGHVLLEDIKSARKSINSLMDSFFRYELEGYHEPLRMLTLASAFLAEFYGSAVNRLNIHRNIVASLGAIKSDSALYALVRNKQENPFTEHNLCAVLSSNLACFYRWEKRVTVRRESVIGSGRADIEITQDGVTAAIIESKVIQERTNIDQAIKDGLNQLYDRYGENSSLELGSYIDLFLIIFSFDKDPPVIAAQLEGAVTGYSNHLGLRCEKYTKGENYLRFSLTDERGRYGFLEKTRTISVYMCNMELNYVKRQKQNTGSKDYLPNRPQHR